MAFCAKSSFTAVGPVTTYICCPNRAHTCMQPKPIEPAATPPPAPPSETRFWYNQVTGACEQFRWDGNVAWANNFNSKEHCETYCGAICPRGYTEINNNGDPRIMCPSVACPNTHSCLTVGAPGRQLCCPTSKYICGTQSGRGINPVPAAAGAPGNSAPTAQTRWAFDNANSQCVQIAGQYSGWGGTYNNFVTQQDCLKFCILSKCTRGEPLKDPTGRDQTCGTSTSCPTGYECSQSVCCPRKRFICIQPKQPGSCVQNIVKYWYNPTINDCVQFAYTGCAGNDNNFESYQSCVTFCQGVKPEPQCVQGQADRDSTGNPFTCSVAGVTGTCRVNFECYFDGFIYGCCPLKSYTCSLSRQAGTACGGTSTRWSYDAATRTCQSFTYNGCDGNSNNFINRQECERYCGVNTCPYGGEAFKDPSGQPRLCNAQTTCPTGYTCVFIGSGVTGVVNHCCMTRTHICQQTPSQGTQCGVQLQRYYFDSANRQCSTFTYLGCGGNENNFATLRECNSFCGSAGCLLGEAAYMDPNTNTALTCGLGSTTVCPLGYTCRADTLSNTNICCGSTDTGVCPAGEKAFIDPLTNSVKECLPSITSNGCPNNYFCRPNAIRNRYYCCTSSNQGLCPIGKAAFRNQITNQPQVCYASTTNQCPQDYACQPTTAGQAQGFCCTIYALCPNGGDFYVDSTTLQPRRCVIQGGTFNICPVGYTCAINPLTPGFGFQNGYCCYNGVIGSSVCSTGFPYTATIGGLPQQCIPGQIPVCPIHYVCTVAVGGGIYYCCSTGTSDGCPTGTNAYLQQPSNTPLLCTGPLNSICPVGFSCQLSPNWGRYQCCTGLATGGAFCSSGQAYISPGGIAPQQCFPGQAPYCPFNYVCTVGIGGGIYYCCSTGASDGCPSGTNAYLQQPSNTPVICNGPTDTICPLGFACQLSPTLGRYQCCTGFTTLARVCSTGQPYSPGGIPQTCVPSLPTFCPVNYACTMGIGGGVYYCCSTNALDGCPAGTNAYLQQPTNTPLICSGPVDTTCPVGFSCKLSPSLARYQCCAGIATGDGCPPGTVGFREPVTNAVRLCVFTGNQCPSPYSCQSTTTGQFQCCGVSGGCPLQMVASINPVTGQPQLCTGGVRCPAGFQCLIAANALQTCCGTGTGTVITLPPAPLPPPPLPPPQTRIPRCPIAGQTPYLVPGSGQAQTCRLGIKTCPDYYQCLNGGDGFICCSSRVATVSNGPCPVGLAFYMDPITRQPQTCTGFAHCPIGYGCRYSTTLRNYYCCSINSVGNKGVGSGMQCWGACVPPNCLRGYTCIGGTCCRTSRTLAFQQSGAFNEREPLTDITSVHCPNGHVFLSSTTNQPAACPLGINHSSDKKLMGCPDGYQCTSVINANANGVCCPGSLNDADD